MFNMLMQVIFWQLFHAVFHSFHHFFFFFCKIYVVNRSKCLIHISHQKFFFPDPFTQMIWHSTQHFGCGKARSRCGKVIAVAYYEPKGNIEGQFHENIFPPVKDDTGNGNCEFYEQDESEETKYCDNNLIVILYINVINLIVLLILVIVVI